MSSLRSTMSFNSNKSTFDELRWVIHIRKTLEEEIEEEGEFGVSIFNVPKLLMASDPDSYIPQQVAIGPYHYWRPELYEMQRYKLAAAKRLQKCLKLDDLVDQLTKLEQRIRSCYHKFLDFNGETLVWMIIVDASFLLEFLQFYTMQKERTEKVHAHDTILRDIVMLENQIPLFVLRKMLEFKFSSHETADDMLVSMFIGLFKEISPFMMINSNMTKVSDSAHLLDFLYDLIIPRLDQKQSADITIEIEIQEQDDEKTKDDKSSSYVKQSFSELWKMLSKLNKGPVTLIKKVLVSKPLKVIVKFPWKIITNIPGAKLLQKPVEYLFSSQQGDEKDEKENSSDTNKNNKPPLMEEITIPSVTQLINSGVRFSPIINGSISNISFDTITHTFHLPAIRIDVNSEVFLRNMVAYEASVGSGALVITRYTELMNGIIDSVEDAKILREKGVIVNQLKSDEEVAKMWNGMSKSLRLSRVPFLDKTIEDVNKYYNSRMKVKIWKFVKSYVFGSWQFLTFLAAIFLLLLMALQAFCSVYTCSRFFNSALQTSD